MDETKRSKRTELDPGVLDRLREAMSRAGVGPTQLSKAAGLAEGHIGLILSDKVASPAATTLAQAARALGVSLDWLMYGTDGCPCGGTASDRPPAPEPREATGPVPTGEPGSDHPRQTGTED